MRITFNTGRTYTPEGQTIIAEQVDGAVLFRDTSRSVAGRIDLIEGLDSIARTPKELENFVMRQYDLGFYTPDACADQL